MGTNNQSIVVKKDDLAKIMKKNLLRNRTITQPKLSKVGSYPAIEMDGQVGPKQIKPEVQGIIP